MNFGQIAARSMRIIGALASGETPTAAEYSDMQTIANSMLDSWNAQRLAIFNVQRSVFVPSTLKQVYTYGPGGDFNAPRPARIERVSVISLASSTQPLELPIDYLTEAQWQLIPTKIVYSALPLGVWDDSGFPLRNMSYWPIPNVQINMVFYDWVQLLTFPDVQTDVEFPPGYLDAIVYNLAVRAAPEFGMGISPEVVALALQTLGVVKSMNMPIIDMSCDPACINPRAQVYNWRSDVWVSR